jgi:hypothetical protein
MSSTRRTTSRLAILFPVLAMAGLAIAGCGGGSTGSHPESGVTPIQSFTSDVTSPPPDSSFVSPSEPPAPSPEDVSPTEPPPADESTTVSGQVVREDTGEPYAGAVVEFKNLYGGNVHTTTDDNGFYSVELPADTYTALALDFNDYNEGFKVTGRPDNAVSVPPSATVDFVAYPIT